VSSKEWKVRLLKKESLFILAMGELDEKKLSPEEMLRDYKGQVRVEKSPKPFEGALVYGFLDLPAGREADVAFLMVMTLCLLVCESRVWARVGFLQPSSYF